MGIWLAVKTRRESNSSPTHQACEMEPNSSFGDLTLRFVGEDETIEKIELSSTNSKFKMEVKTDTPISVCNQFGAFSVEIFVQIAREDEVSAPAERSAFSVLMGKASERGRPSKEHPVKNSVDQIYNDLLDYLSELGIDWVVSVINTTGKNFVKSLTDLIWHITLHHDKFSSRAAHLPEFVTKRFSGCNNYLEKHQAKSAFQLSEKKLRKHISELSNCLSQPWMLRNKSFQKDIGILVEACQKMANYMKQCNTKNQEKRKSVSKFTSDDVNIEIRHGCPGSVSSEYQMVEEKLCGLEMYEPLHLADYEPEERYQRRHWTDKLHLSTDVAFMKKSYGGRIGNINIIWKIDRSNENHDQEMGKTLLLVNNGLPEYHTRQMRKDFIQKFSNISRVPTEVLRQMYQDITGDDSKATNKSEENRRQRLVEILASHEDEGLVQDMRSINGKVGSTVFDEFWDEVQALFDEYTASVQERRHGSVLYLPFAISIRELMERVKKRKPDIKVPSAEWVRLQFQPKNPCSLAAMAHTGRFDIKYQVQRRQLRANHDDAKYVFHQQRYLKEFAVKFREHTIMVSADDKAVIPVGEPEHAVSTGVRAHNKSLGSSDPNTAITALDHDWKIAGIVPSVNLFVEIPESSKDTFFSGQPTVTLKDRIFQKSGPLRHGAELSGQIKDRINDFWKSILLLVTDGGGDHNVTNPSVQAGLVSLFVDLDLDFLCAMRTCPTQSWTNLAERVMSILNIALQHCALERDKMSAALEDLMKKCKNIGKVRSEAEDNAELKDAFLSSLENVQSLVADRFERMMLKDNQIVCPKPCDENDILAFFESLKKIDDNVEIDKLNAACLTKLEAYSQFVTDHCIATSYTFQIRKCKTSTCRYCSEHPVRLNEDVFDSLQFIPAPLLDASREHFQTFEQVYGSTVTEKDRPSLKYSLELIDEDKLHKDVLVGQKVRAVVKCALCDKPRCLYSNSKFNTVVERNVKEIIKDGEYACGGSFVDDENYLRHSVVARRQLTCSSPLETTYYSCKLSLAPLCFHCGSTSGAKLADLSDMSEKFAQVRPLCLHCKGQGLKAATRAPKMTHPEAKKKKKSL